MTVGPHRKTPVISVGMMILGASMSIVWQAGSVEVLIGARVVQGIALACCRH